MRRAAFTISLVSLLAAMLVLTASAFGLKAGFNLPTKRLEAAYKIALRERRFSQDGCYPPAPALAKALQKGTGHKVGVAGGPGGLRNLNEVYVLRQGASCDHLRMALRATGGTYVLGSVSGTIRILGHKGVSTPGVARPITDFTIATQAVHLSKPDTVQRGQAICPRGRFPLGGGMITAPPNGSDGEGIYPHSYERLGAQRGWHVSVVLLDPTPSGTTSRTVTVQALCGRGVVPATPTPHKTVYIRPGETKTATAHCPGGQSLVSGGFQRTDFRSDGGDYITESKAVGTNAWTVSGHAYGTGPGELTAIAYCARMKRPIIKEVASTPAALAVGQSATATTPTCPVGTRMVTGGFSSNGSTNSLFAAGSFNQDGTFSATSYGFFGATPQLTAFGYCLPSRS
jgi:hypothetical protein